MDAEPVAARRASAARTLFNYFLQFKAETAVGCPSRIKGDELKSALSLRSERQAVSGAR